MSKKLYGLLSGILGGLAAIADACVVYFVKDAALAAKIVAAITIGAKAIDEVLLIFVKDEAKK